MFTHCFLCCWKLSHTHTHTSKTKIFGTITQQSVKKHEENQLEVQHFPPVDQITNPGPTQDFDKGWAPRLSGQATTIITWSPEFGHFHFCTFQTRKSAYKLIICSYFYFIWFLWKFLFLPCIYKIVSVRIIFGKISLTRLRKNANERESRAIVFYLFLFETKK